LCADIDGVEGGAHRLGAAEVRRGLHKFDVLVQVLRETVLRRADDDITIDGVLPQMEFLHVPMQLEQVRDIK